MNPILERCLQDLEERIDPEEEDRLLRAWIDFSAGRCRESTFLPRRRRANPPRVDWPKVGINEALEDFDLMALQQYRAASEMLAQGGGQLLNVRCNYGSSIAPLLFGVEVFVMDPDLETLPTSRPLNDRDAIRRLIDAGIPDLNTGYGARVLEMGRRYLAINRRFPKIAKYVWVYHPDLQGPLDICEVVWGSGIFYAAYDEPELVKQMLDLATRTYAAYLHAWLQIVPFHAGGNSHWGLYHQGNIMLRDDSAMNFSPKMFDEFVRPYDQRLLDEFGGGAIHFCGHGDHYISSMAQMRHLYAINLSQPHLNDMEKVYQHTVDKGIKLLNLTREAAEQAMARDRDLRGCAHVA